MAPFATAAFLVLLSLYVVFRIVLLINSIFARRRLAALEHELLRSQIEKVTKSAGPAAGSSLFAWNGLRKFEVFRRIDEGGSIASFYLRPHDQKPLPPFRAGQYLIFQLEVPDALSYPGGRRQAKNTVIRCYSLSDSPNHPDHYRVTIKKNPAAA